jgi:N,N'-diacetyllegionaminate synthase
MPAKIGERTIGDGYPTYIVLEAGPTHTGLESAKKLVDAAADTGADAIKFQMLDADRLMGEKDVLFSYKVLTDREKNTIEAVEEQLYEILKRRVLTKEEWKALKLYCDQKKIAFISTAVFHEEVDFLVDELEVQSIKLSSGDINHTPLIRHIAKKGVNIQMDTGSSDIWEIERTVGIIEAEGNRNMIIHLCPTGYPARLESIHLRMLTTLKMLFGDYAIAFSDHTPGWEMDIAAIALGAHLVEKTITLDRTTRSCEHMFSIEPQEAKHFVNIIRELEIALGNYRRTIPQEQRDSRVKVRRSIYLNKDLNSGKTLTTEDIDFRRPGDGIRPEEIDYIVGKKLTRKVSRGEKLRWEDICL